MMMSGWLKMMDHMFPSMYLGLSEEMFEDGKLKLIN